MKIKPGGIRAGLEVYKEYVDNSFVSGFATDGIVYSPVATFGTTAVEVFNKLIDPGVTMELKQFQAGLTQRFTGLNASISGSIGYYWRVRSEAVILGSAGPIRVDGPYIGLTATYMKLMGTLIALEDTLSGNASLSGSLPYAPVRVSLMAIGLAAANVKGEVKSSCWVKLVGNAIPGT